jgi:FkbM family methyltransferase
VKILVSLRSLLRELLARTGLPAKRQLRKLAHAKGIGLSFPHGAISFRKGTKELILPAKNFIYIREVIDSFSYYFDSVVPASTPRGELIDLSRPRKLILRDEGLAFWMNSLTEPARGHRFYFERYKPTDGDICLDCGANYGYVTYLMSKMVGELGRVISFEPDPETFEMLKRNVEEHRLKNVTIVNKALWNEKTVLNFNAEGSLGGGLVRTINRDKSMLKQQISVETTTLEEVAHELNLPRIDFVKMDIEGAELEVLQSSGKLLARHKTRLAVASEHLRDGQLTFGRVEQILKEAGYEVATSDLAMLNRSKVLLTWGWRKE